MPGTKTGGSNARQTMIEKYGADYYARIGSLGGKRSTKPKGFAWMKANGQLEKVRQAGIKGGANSKRGSKQA
jgi:hypothetical protein